ncbi:MAG: hypothetical protein AB9873_12635 [Syntrophobacteraceae bacterium]
MIVNVAKDLGTAVNSEAGELSADTGLIGLYGREVRQDGEIKAYTAIKKGGAVELLASEKVQTGAKSLTATPVSDSDERAHESFQFKGGTIKLGGLDPGKPLASVPTKVIEHKGVLEAHSGVIDIEAANRVFLDSGSKIDVSGSWITKEGSAGLVEAQLNSVELRDSYGQKDGVLKGKKITVPGLQGTDLADISGSFTSQELTAKERSVSGGQVFISVRDGDILMKPESVLNFSGGGVRYSNGFYDSSMLLAGQKVYAANDAPEWLRYDGLSKGVYLGGTSPVRMPTGGQVEAADAGLAHLIARNVRLDGKLDGSVRRGYYQIMAEEPVDTFGRQTARGWKEPTAGTLIIGENYIAGKSPELQDFVVDSITIDKEVTPLPLDFNIEDQPYDPGNPRESVLSSRILSDAGLGDLQLNANLVFRTTESAEINLARGGSFSVNSRRVEHLGDIVVPSGTIGLILNDNLSTFETLLESQNDRYVPLQQRIFLGDQCRLVVAGEMIDNSFARFGAEHANGYGKVQGGQINIKDRTELGEGVLVKEGALIDVSGGYEITPSGSVLGGNAGGILLQGDTVALDGAVRGFSIFGKDGGKLTVHASEVLVSEYSERLPASFGAADVIPGWLSGKFTMAGNQFDGSGLTQLELRSPGSITLADGAGWTPSHIKLALPYSIGSVAPGSYSTLAFQNQLSGTPLSQGLLSVDLDWIGASSFKASAGILFDGALPGSSADPDARIVLGTGSDVRLSPLGKIELSGPTITIDSLLDAPAGQIILSSGLGDLTLGSGSTLRARGYNRANITPVFKGGPLGHTVYSAGSITLDGGNLRIEDGVHLDVSAGEPVFDYVRLSNGRYRSVQTSGNPGSLSLSFFGELILDGAIHGEASLTGGRGGTLSILNKNEGNFFDMTAEDIGRYLDAGFDALTLGSRKGLRFIGPMDYHLARSLTIDAPEIVGTQEDHVQFDAPWIRLVNSFLPAAGTSIQQEGATMSLHGGWIDVEGGMHLTSFETVSLNADQDIRLFDRKYKVGQTFFWQGSLDTLGDLTLQAEAIYPGSASEFKLSVGGKLTTLPQASSSGLIASAGGRLVLEVGDLDHRGALAAPNGEISIKGLGSESRLYFAEGSRVSVAGSELATYGTLDESTWTVTDKQSGLAAVVENSPSKAITLSAGEVIVREGSEIDAAGGGNLFAYQFEPGIEGSVDPLKKSGRYVIMPNDPMALPGEAIYLEGNAFLKEGTYSLLPEQYAFLPGAMILTDTGKNIAPGQHQVTKEGYRVLAGSAAFSGTELRGTTVKGYSIRRAEDVLREGHFNHSQLVTGDGGTVALSGGTTVLDGVIKAGALEGHNGGSISLSGRNIVIQAERTPLPVDFNFDSALPAQFAGNLLVSEESISLKGLDCLSVGDSATAETITVKGGVSLEAPNLSFTASREILVESGAELYASSKANSSDEGQLSFHALGAGQIVVEEGAQVHASNGLALDAGSIDIREDLLVDHGFLSLAADRIFVVADGYQPLSGSGLYLTESQWNAFGATSDFRLLSRTDLSFLGDLNLRTVGSLSFDAASIMGQSVGGSGSSTVVIDCQGFNLANTSGLTGAGSLQDLGSFTLKALEISVNNADERFDGFAEVHLGAAKDILLRGKGAIRTDGNLTLASAAVRTLYFEDESTPYTPAHFMIDAGGRLALKPSGGTTIGESSPGGILELNARSIEHAGVLDVTSGQLSLSAWGDGADDGVFVRNGASILARGSSEMPGSAVGISSSKGTVSIEQGAVIDVSAGSQGDAGSIEISSPSRSAQILGDLSGKAGKGKGGSFLLDTFTVDSLTNITTLLARGGFDESIGIRVRRGDLVLSTSEAITGHRIDLAADQGRVEIRGALDSSGPDGGLVRINAGQDVILRESANILAVGEGSSGVGGQVYLNSKSGWLQSGGRLSHRRLRDRRGRYRNPCCVAQQF